MFGNTSFLRARKKSIPSAGFGFFLFFLGGGGVNLVVRGAGEAIVEIGSEVLKKFKSLLQKES